MNFMIILTKKKVYLLKIIFFLGLNYKNEKLSKKKLF